MINYLRTIFVAVLLFNIISLNAQSYYTKRNIETNLNSYTTINGQWNASNPINNTLGVIHYQGLNFGFDVNNYPTLVNGVESSDLYFGRWSGNWKGWKKIVMENESGNVGIGVDNPTTKLEITGNDVNILEVAGFYNSAGYGDVTNKSEARINIGKIEQSRRQPMGAIGAFPTSNDDSSNGNLAFYTRENQSVFERVRIKSNGNVGIGTTSPDSKLTVAGNIHAREVKVTIRAGEVPDYVFANDYKLKSLQEVEEYIKENSHLPEIPSAQEIEKNGLMLAEMNLNLLKKMEEMTLYMIEMKKENENLKSSQRLLEERIKIIETK